MIKKIVAKKAKKRVAPKKPGMSPSRARALIAVLALLALVCIYGPIWVMGAR